MDDVTTTLTVGDGLRLARQIAEYFFRRGVRRGDVVLLDLPSVLSHVVTVALNGLGALTGQYPRLLAEGHFHADWLVSSTLTTSPLATHTIVFESSTVALIDGLPGDVDAVPPTLDEPFRLVFTSGSTGYPKPVALTTRELLRRMAVAARIRPGTSLHLSGLGTDSIGGLRTWFAHLFDRTTFLTTGEPEHVAQQLARHPVTYASLSPYQARELLTVVTTGGPSPRSLERVMIAGSSVTAELASALRSVLGVEVLTTYASTEAGMVTMRLADSADPLDVGPLVEDVTLEVVDEDYRLVAPGVEGVLRYRRDGMATEYFRDPEASARAFRDGWFYPGDRGSLSEDGRLLITGRVDELINVGGNKFDPARYEAVALEIVGVRDAGGFAFPRADASLVPALAVTVDGTFRPDELRDALHHAFARLAPEVIVQVGEIPRTPLGKVRRAVLAELASANQL